MLQIAHKTELQYFLPLYIKRHGHDKTQSKPTKTAYILCNIWNNTKPIGFKVNYVRTLNP
jgi:hypothetical protein